jgi:hypothetical protein
MPATCLASHLLLQVGHHRLGDLNTVLRPILLALLFKARMEFQRPVQTALLKLHHYGDAILKVIRSAMLAVSF